MFKKLFILSFFVSVLLSTEAQNEEFLFSPRGIAEIHITLEDGKNINDIKNEKANVDYVGKLKATMVVKNSSQSTYGSTDLFSGKILIDGRGNTTWHRPKRPYNIDLVADDWDTEVAAALLGMPAGEEWSLLAFWNDRSLMRFQIASYLGQYMDGLQWMPKNRYVEVWINNEYRGLYALTEKILRDKNRVDVKKNDPLVNLSGGYILEASSDEKFNDREKAVQFRTAKYDINMTFKYPKAKNVTPEQRSWIINYLNEFETALDGNDYKDPIKGYPKYMNVNSFIDWTIIHELSKGPDNLFHASVFLQKDRDGKLDMSSPWDFDLSFGNSGIYTIEGSWVRTHRWFWKLYQDSEYAQNFNARYDELLPLFDKIPTILQDNYVFLENSGVLNREFGKFPEIILDFQSDGDKRTTPTSYKGHVEYLSDWIMSRSNWIYLDLASSDNQEKGRRMTEVTPIIRVMAPEYRDKMQSFEVQVMRKNDNTPYLYSWNDGAFSLNWTRTISQKGKYWVKIKDEWGNISQVSDTLYFGVEKPTSIQRVKSELLFTITNPTKGVVFINYSSPISNSTLAVSLLDLQGKKIRTEIFNVQTGFNQLLMPTDELKTGTYIVQIQADNKITSRKVIFK